MRSITPNPTPSGAGVPAAAKVPGSREAKAWSQAQDFESVFLSTMLGQMFTGLGEESPLGQKKSEAWRGLLVEEYGRSISSNGGVGLANNIYRELIGAQEAPARRVPPAYEIARGTAAAGARPAQGIGATP